MMDPDEATNVLHGPECFAAVPWEQLDPERLGPDWHITVMPKGLRSSTWYVSRSTDAGKESWRLPDALCCAIDAIAVQHEHIGRREARNAMRDALGLPWEEPSC